MRIILILLGLMVGIICNCQYQKTKTENLPSSSTASKLSQNADTLSQNYPTAQLQGTEVRQLKSKMVEGMAYKLFISLPDNYESSTDSYPVLYFLDAWAQFGIIRQSYWLLRFYDEVPPLIIVGIAYEGSAQDHVFYRARDYTPTKVPKETLGRLGDFTPTSGGAPEFIQFMENELFPMIENEYRARKSDRAIFGVSYGGLFGAYALFKHTELFQRYFIGSPPIWWDDEITLKYENSYANNNHSLPAKVFMAIGGEENPVSYNKLRDRLLSRNYSDFQFTSTIFENETHMSVVPAAHSRAMRVLYNPRD